MTVLRDSIKRDPSARPPQARFLRQVSRSLRRSWAEYLGQVGVAEPALGVEFVAQRDKVPVLRVRLAQVFRASRMHLAPMRPPGNRGHHGLHVAEVLLMRRGVEDMDRDVGAGAAESGGQPEIVTGSDPDLD